MAFQLLIEQWLIHLMSSAQSYNPGQNYVGHFRMLRLDHRSFFTWKQNVLWAKFYLPPSPHAMLFRRKGFLNSHPTLHRDGGGGGGGGTECLLTDTLVSRQLNLRTLLKMEIGFLCLLRVSAVSK